MPAGILKALAEAVGTFALVFAGIGAIAINDATGGTVTHVGVALTCGLVVMAMIDAVGDVSGAHLNPAVTLGVCVSKRVPAAAVSACLGSQVAGATLLSLLLRAMFRDHPTLGPRSPSGMRRGRSCWRRS